MTVFASVAAGHVAEAREMREAIPMKTNFMIGSSGWVFLSLLFFSYFIYKSFTLTDVSYVNNTFNNKQQNLDGKFFLTLKYYLVADFTRRFIDFILLSMLKKLY